MPIGPAVNSLRLARAPAYSGVARARLVAVGYRRHHPVSCVMTRLSSSTAEQRAFNPLVLGSNPRGVTSRKARPIRIFDRAPLVDAIDSSVLTTILTTNRSNVLHEHPLCSIVVYLHNNIMNWLRCDLHRYCASPVPSVEHCTFELSRQSGRGVASAIRPRRARYPRPFARLWRTLLLHSGQTGDSLLSGTHHRHSWTMSWSGDRLMMLVPKIKHIGCAKLSGPPGTQTVPCMRPCLRRTGPTDIQTLGRVWSGA